MDNPLSSVVTSIYIKHFETLAIESARLKPATWLRYVDDIIVVSNEGMDKLQDFRPSWQWRWRRTGDFLSWICCHVRDRLSKTVYRKATYTDRYIHFTSNHQNKVKWGVIKYLKWRATRIWEIEDLEEKEDYLRMTFQKTGPIQRSSVRLRTRQEAQQAEGTVTEAFNSRRKTLCICEANFGHLQKGWSTFCVPTEDNTEGSTHKSERITEAHGQGCSVPDPLCTV